MLIKIFAPITIIVIELIINKISFINKYNNEFTLDGNCNKVKVKRKYLLKNENQLYYELNIIELLPGDIILLKNNDYVPCDCIILNGECIVNESDLTGSLNIYKKIALKNNSEYFNYKYSNINILYHGMKIIKTFSKSNNGYVTVLCINIGANTFKANQYSNTLYFLERKKEYNKVYNLFGERKKIILYIILNILISFIITILHYFLFQSQWNYTQSGFFKKYIPTIAVAIICKSLMAVFFIIQNILILFDLFRLNKKNIICFDKSRLIKSGKINKIIFNKTETLSENIINIHSCHPVFYNIKKPNKLIFKNYSINQIKDLNKLLFDYYQNYLNDNLKNNNSEFTKILFLECLLCCNSIEKYDTDFFGNNLELGIFKDMKWDIEQNEEINANNNFKIKFVNNIDNPILSSQNYCYIISKISDIFPKHFYLLTGHLDIDNLKESKQMNCFRKGSIITISSSFKNDSNIIQTDISNFSIISYRLRIYKKFIFNGNYNSASIVYNLLTKELRFMIKGYPENIINKCDKNTLPKNFEKIISLHRKNGLIILVCATKKLEMELYNDKDELDNYMENLTFLGILTLENKIKNNIKNSIKILKKYNDDFLIISGDSVYNCLSTGFLSGIIEDKNIFILDKEENNKITIRKICSHKNIQEKDNQFKVSRINKNYNYKRTSSLLLKNLDHNENINTERNNKEDIDINLFESNNNPEIETNMNKIMKRANLQIKKRIKYKDFLYNANSENERIINKNNSISKRTEDKLNNKIANQDGNSNLEDNLFREEINSNYLNFMENIIIKIYLRNIMMSKMVYFV